MLAIAITILVLELRSPAGHSIVAYGAGGIQLCDEFYLRGDFLEQPSSNVVRL